MSSFTSIDLTAALRRIADRRIEEAMREGKFDNLEGAGRPLELEPMPAEENARLQWWALRILRQNDFVPDEVQLRRTIEALKAKLRTLGDEASVEKLALHINKLVHRLNTLGTNAIRCNVAPIDREAEIARLKQRDMPTDPA
jgi:hypothetical protein